jgi:hypothetical protein
MRTGPRILLAALALAPALPALRAWNYDGHRIVNQLALASLPADFPAWVREPASAERIAFLSGEPDRWRNTKEELLQHDNGLDHYIDLEELADAGISLDSLTPFRYDFAVQFAAGREAHADRFPAIDPAKDADHSRRWPGFLPWAIAEYYARLQSAFSYLKTFERYGTPEEVANAKENIVYEMGVMGHYVGDGSQPLHVTRNHHGWVGANPNGYSTQYGIHALIDGGFIAKVGITATEILPGVATAEPVDVTPRADGRDPVFVAVVDYLRAGLAEVEPLYRIEKEGGFRAAGPPGPPEGRRFIDGQLLKGGEMLGRLWLTAWRQAGPDTYLQAELIRRGPSPSR